MGTRFENRKGGAGGASSFQKGRRLMKLGEGVWVGMRGDYSFDIRNQTKVKSRGEEKKISYYPCVKKKKDELKMRGVVGG